MLRKIVLTAFLSFLLLGLVAAANAADDPGLPDTVRVNSVTANAGEQVVVTVDFYNDEELGGVTLPLGWDSPDVTLASADWTGGRLDYINFKTATIDNDNQTANLGAIVFFESYVPTGVGLAVTLTFDVAPGASDQVVTIDSVVIPPAANLLFTLTDGFNFTPQMKSGTITIGNPAPTIGATPTSFTFNSVEGAINPDPQDLTIFNDGAGTLNWTVSDNASWLSLDPASGTDVGNVSVAVDITGLSPNTYGATITITDPAATNSQVDIPVELVISPAPVPTIAFSPATISFTATEGASNPADQDLSISNSGEGTLNWTVSDNADWLSLDPTSGTDAGMVTLSADITGLTPDTYYAAVTITDPAATNNPVEVPVQLTIEAAPVPTIAVTPTSFTFSATEGAGNPATQDLSISNSGEGTLNWTVVEGVDWLSLNPTSGTDAGTVTLTVDITGLVPDVYNATIFVSDPTATNDPVNVPVQLTVEAAPVPTIAVTPTSFTFSATEGAGNPATQDLSISNSGDGTLNWTVVEGVDWLSLNPTSGTDAGVVTLTVDITGLVPDVYNATILVSDPSATNDPVNVPVQLTVEAAPVPSIGLDPMEFTFNATVGEPNPTPKTLIVRNTGSGTLNWTANVLNASTWLSIDPTSGTDEGPITVTVDITGLTADVYKDTIVVLDPAADNSPQKAVVTLNVSAAPMAFLNVEPLTLTFNATAGDAPTVQLLTITNTGTAPLNWAVTPITSGPLSYSPASGTDYGEVYVTLMSDVAAPGTYIDSVEIADPAANNSPQIIVITSNIAPAPVASIGLDPGLLAFTAVEAGSNPASQTLTITNEGDAELNWTASILHGSPWLSIDPTSGTDDGAVTVAVDITGLVADTYEDTIVVADPAADNSPQMAVVTLTVTNAPHPTIDLSTDALAFTANEGEANPAMQSFVIGNSGAGTLNWTATKLQGSTWLSFSPTSGSDDATVEVTVDITGLAADTYVDTISIADPNATNSPRAVGISLTVVGMPSEPDVVEVGSDTVTAGEQAVVEIQYTNYGEIAGFTLPLTFDNSLVTVDSVSFAGARVEYFDNPIIQIDNAGGTVLVSGLTISEPLLSPGSGLLATIYFATNAGSTGDIVVLDTTFIAPNGLYQFVDGSAADVETDFYTGYIVIEEGGTPCFDFPVDSLHFSAEIGHSIPSLSLPVTNTCDGVLTWTVASDEDWLTLSPTSGGVEMVTFSIDTDGLDEGDYLAHATFESNGHEGPFVVKVTLHIYAVPILAVSQTEFDFGDVCYGDVMTSSFDVTNDGTGYPIHWEATVPSTGFTVDPAMGTTPSTVEFSVATDELGMGYQEHIIGINSDDAENGPINVVVKMNIIDCGECTFKIDEVEGPQGFPVGVPVYANGIDDIVGVQFNIWYDSTVIQPDSITSNYMGGPTIGFNDWVIRYIWDNVNTPLDINGDPIMTLWFTCVGDIGVTSPLEWVDHNEIVTSDAQPVHSATFCDGSVMIVEPVHDINGNIVYYDMATPVPDVDVNLSGDASDMTYTDEHGDYSFKDLYAGQYTITPMRTADDAGVSVADAVKIRLHLAATEVFTSPYQLIAGDVNMSNMVTVADVVQIRLYITKLITGLPSGNWTFVDGDYPIDMDNWYMAPRYVDVEMNDMDVEAPQMVAVRMGDVNYSWPDGRSYPKSGTSGTGIFLEDMEAQAGELVTLPITVAEANDLAGFEIHLGYDSRYLTVENIESELVTNMTTNATADGIHLVWEDVNNTISIPSSQTVARVTFRVSNSFEGSTDVTVDGAELANSGGNTYTIQVDGASLFSGSNGNPNLPMTYNLKQNTPNPFNPRTSIQATMEEPGEYELAVFNITGEKIRVYSGWHGAGVVDFVWDGRNDAGIQVPSGIYFYRFTAGAFSETKQMILLK